MLKFGYGSLVIMVPSTGFANRLNHAYRELRRDRVIKINKGAPTMEIVCARASLLSVVL